MTSEERLAAIRSIIQRDVGGRGLDRNPDDNLFTALPGDFSSACRSIAHSGRHIGIVTGFFIVDADPPAAETDGPPGAVFLAAALRHLGYRVSLFADRSCWSALERGLDQIFLGPSDDLMIHEVTRHGLDPTGRSMLESLTHLVSIECVGPAADGRCYSMRGRDVTEFATPGVWLFDQLDPAARPTTIGIGDGGNEIGMGKIPGATLANNIPLAERIHCQISVDHLIVAGISNWGAFGLAAGIAVARGIALPRVWLNPARERAVLERMIEAGNLVDGVTKRQAVTVDGLAWDDYIQPLREIAAIPGVAT